jgi:hypothetical protein
VIEASGYEIIVRDVTVERGMPTVGGRRSLSACAGLLVDANADEGQRQGRRRVP